MQCLHMLWSLVPHVRYGVRYQRDEVVGGAFDLCGRAQFIAQSVRVCLESSLTPTVLVGLLPHPPTLPDNLAIAIATTIPAYVCQRHTTNDADRVLVWKRLKTVPMTRTAARRRITRGCARAKRSSTSSATRFS